MSNEHGDPPFFKNHIENDGQPKGQSNGLDGETQIFCGVCRNVTRNGAQFCSNACRQKAYRNRTKNGNSTNPEATSEPDEEAPIVCETLALIPITSIAPRPWAY